MAEQHRCRRIILGYPDECHRAHPDKYELWCPVCMREWEAWLDRLAAENPGPPLEVLVGPAEDAPCPLEQWQLEQFQAWLAAGSDLPAWTLTQVCWASPN